MTALTTTFTIEVVHGPTTGRGQGRIDKDGMAVAELPGIDGPRELPSQLLPSWLAALIGLGPRPRPEVHGVLYTDPARLDRLLSTRDWRNEPATILGTAELPPQWATALGRLRGRVVAHWRLTVSGVLLEVLDAGEAGLWRVDRDHDEEGRISLQATDPTQVWRWLTALASIA